ncbi:MAG: glycosyltransferase family 4 protein [Candidatus Hodarchaeota archaeon]
MNVVVDGIIYQIQSNGGISRLYTEILPRMCDIDESMNIRLLTGEKLKQRLPKHSRITYRALPLIERYLRPGRIWKPIVPRANAIVQRLWAGRGTGKIWHSTYYTLPGKWDGMQVVTIVDMIHERFTELYDKPENEQFRERKRKCVLAADAVICISEATRQDVQHLYGIDLGRIQVIPLAHSDVFKTIKNNELLPPPVDRPFLLYVGSRTHHKNFDGLLNAYRIWVGRKEVDLVVVSENWSAHDERHLARLRMRDRVHLVGNIADVRLCHLYNHATAFVYPSLFEGFGIPVLEAMACGCPVVASRIPSTIEVAGECPIYFEPTQVESLLDALDVALFERRDSARVQAGLKHVKRYSWDKTARQTLDVYRELYGNNE